MTKMTVKQEKFCLAIVSGEHEFDWQAYDAVYSSKTTSMNTKYCETWKLLQNPQIAQRIKELRNNVAKESEATLIEVLEELANWVRLDPIDFVDENGCVKNIHDMPKEVRKCLSSPIEVMELFSGRGEEREKIGELKTIRFVDRTKAIDMMMKKLGQYITKLELKTDDLTHIKELLDSIKK
jgi:phage terminase small subunit